jgi:carotenoid cleavage dioxygenase-like enzyme
MAEPIYGNYGVPRLFETPIDARPVRFTIDLAAGCLTSRIELPYCGAAEFPTIAAANAQRACTEFWGLGFSAPLQPGAKFFDRLVRLSWRERSCVDAYEAPDGTFLGGEPLLLRSSAAARRWIACQIFDVVSMRSGLAIFDAFALADGPIARAWLAEPTPMAFHGCFVPRRAPMEPS